MKKLSVILSVLFFMTSTQAANMIVLKADKWCPFNCSKENVNPGYVVEIAKTVFKEAKYIVNYDITPWAQAIQEAKDGKVDGIIGASPGDISEAVWPSESIGKNKECVYSLNGSKLIYTSPESLKGLRVGLTEGYAYSEVFTKYLEKKEITVTKSQSQEPLLENLDLLLNKKIDVLIENENVVEYTISNRSKYSKVNKLGCNTSDDLFIAFSAKNPKSKEYARILDEGIKSLRQKGELQKILAKYKVEDWK